MMACKKMEYDGIAYYSRRVDNELFALCTINLYYLLIIMVNILKMIKHIKIFR